VKNDDEERYMITKAAHFFARPALDPIFEEVYVDDKMVLVVEIRQSNMKPHYALADDGKWWVYVRVKDKSVLASKVVVDVLKRSSGTEGVLIAYSDYERTLLTYLENNPQINIKECCKVLKLSRPKAQKLLVNLILSGIVKIHTSEKEEYYTSA
jgi:predicted HTH transcriptional regulator